MKKSYLIFSFLLLTACGYQSRQNELSIVSMQLIDRNGFSETISNKDRLSLYQKIDFLTAQPYQKVLRVYARDIQGKSTSKITSYHPNGQVSQYLEVMDGRAHGLYNEWFSNGRIKLEAKVIEGMADIHEMAQATWLFDGACKVWDEEGCLVAEFFYDKGSLENTSLYYHPNGQVQKSVPYVNHEIEGILNVWDDKGILIEKMEYKKGLKNGKCQGYWNLNTLSYDEDWTQGKLDFGKYYSPNGEQIAEIEHGKGTQAVFKDEILYALVSYQNGVPEGPVKTFHNQTLHTLHHIKNGVKHGEEWEYYPSKEDPKPKLFLFWQNDVIQGVVKTWYDNGIMESQKEMHENKKHGLSFAWYRDGSLMLMEEYEKDALVKGSYYKKGDKLAVSKVENGKGIATLYNPDGYFLKKITYEKGKPILDPPQI